MKKCSLQYNPEENVVYIDTLREDFIPKYLYYLFQFHRIPTDVKVYFKGESQKNAKKLEIKKEKGV